MYVHGLLTGSDLFLEPCGGLCDYIISFIMIQKCLDTGNGCMFMVS